MPGVDLSGGSPGPGSAPPVFGPGPGTAPPASGAAGGLGGFGGGGGNPGGGFQSYVAQAALNNPTVQHEMKNAAYSHGSQAFEVASQGLSKAMTEIRKNVREGPAGISILCFIGGLATAVFGIIGLCNLTSLSAPFNYLLNIYLTGFGFVTVLLEADMESFKNWRILGHLAPVLESYQIQVFTRASFLTELRGRALFYIFIGSLAITQCWFCLFFFAGLWNLAMGVFCLLMSFGINPADHIPMAEPRPGGSPMMAGDPNENLYNQHQPYSQQQPY